jgi:hypothetical protein
MDCAAAPGTTMITTAVLLIATGTIRITVTTITVFVVPSTFCNFCQRVKVNGFWVRTVISPGFMPVLALVNQKVKFNVAASSLSKAAPFN